jgi:hypothetical protein
VGCLSVAYLGCFVQHKASTTSVLDRKVGRLLPVRLRVTQLCLGSVFLGGRVALKGIF